MTGRKEVCYIVDPKTGIEAPRSPVFGLPRRHFIRIDPVHSIHIGQHMCDMLQLYLYTFVEGEDVAEYNLKVHSSTDDVIDNKDNILQVLNDNFVKNAIFSEHTRSCVVTPPRVCVCVFDLLRACVFKPVSTCVFNVIFECVSHRWGACVSFCVHFEVDDGKMMIVITVLYC